MKANIYFIAILFLLFSGNALYGFEIEVKTSSEEDSQYEKENFFSSPVKELTTLHTQSSVSLEVPLGHHFFQLEELVTKDSITTADNSTLMDVKDNWFKATWQWQWQKADIQAYYLGWAPQAEAGAYQRDATADDFTFYRGGMVHLEENESFIEIKIEPEGKTQLTGQGFYATRFFQNQEVQIGWIFSKTKYFSIYGIQKNLYDDRELLPYETKKGIRYENRKPQEPSSSQYWRAFKWFLEQKKRDDISYYEVNLLNQLVFMSGDAQFNLDHQLEMHNFREKNLLVDDYWEHGLEKKGELLQKIDLTYQQNLFQSSYNLQAKIGYHYDPFQERRQIVRYEIGVKAIL